MRIKIMNRFKSKIKMKSKTDRSPNLAHSPAPNHLPNFNLPLNLAPAPLRTSAPPREISFPASPSVFHLCFICG